MYDSSRCWGPVRESAAGDGKGDQRNLRAAGGRAGRVHLPVRGRGENPDPSGGVSFFAKKMEKV